MLEQQDWIRVAPDMEIEWRQQWEEGRDAAAFQDRCRALARRAVEGQDCEAEADALCAAMQRAPTRAGYPYEEPEEWEALCAVRGPAAQLPAPARDRLPDRIAGAWTGRIAGCLLGKPLEMLRSATIEDILHSTGNWPLSRYIDSRTFPEGLAERVAADKAAPWEKCWVDTIGGAAPVDDDTNYTVFALKLVETYGRDFRPNDVLEGWLTWLPMLSTCTAERAAYRNAAQGLTAPDTARRRNPYREWIGAQIRGDFFGYINPGHPRAAAEMAWRDGCISHVRNGVYGELYAAALVAAAASAPTMEAVVQAALAEIPPRSRLYAEVCEVLEGWRSGRSWDDTRRFLVQRFDENCQHDWCHVLSNARIVTAALLYGGGDFGRSICLAVGSAFDTDCNGATVGSVVGMFAGAAAIPTAWTEPFGGKLRTSIDGHPLVSVGELTKKTLALCTEEEKVQ